MEWGQILTVKHGPVNYQIWSWFPNMVIIQKKVNYLIWTCFPNMVIVFKYGHTFKIGLCFEKNLSKSIKFMQLSRKCLEVSLSPHEHLFLSVI